MSKVIVTGGAGMIESNLVKKLIGLKHEVHVIDNLWRGQLEYLNVNETATTVINTERDFYNIELSEGLRRNYTWVENQMKKNIRLK